MTTFDLGEPGAIRIKRPLPPATDTADRKHHHEHRTTSGAAAFAMPLTSPAFPPGPYRFMQREFLVITYRTDMDALRAVVPEPLEVAEPLVKYEFIRMPDSTGFGDYTESGQVIPVQLRTSEAWSKAPMCTRCT